MGIIPRFGFRTRVFLHDFAIKDFAVSTTGPHCLELLHRRAALAHSLSNIHAGQCLN
jgi:hypothetical protein